LLPINRDLYKQSSDSLKDYQINFSKEAVISVSAAETYHLIKEYAVHACPGNYRYQKTGYITFRMPPRGEMEQIYKIEKIITISRSQINDIRQGSYFVPLGGDNRRIKDLKQLLTENEKERFEGYVKNSPFMHYLKESQMGYDVEDRFYFLSPYTLIPKGFLPKIYSTQPEYYSISEMVNPIK